MTCIVGIENDEGAWIGGDSAASDGNNMRITGLSKVAYIGRGLTIGYSSSFRLGNLVHERLVYEIPSDVIWRYTATFVDKFIPALRKVLKDEGYMKVENNEETGGFLLVGSVYGIWEIACDLQVQYYTNGLYAIGSAEQVALGSLYSTRRWRDPVKRLEEALKAASEYTPWVRPPFTVLKMKER